ncbi:hypothetical protein [Novosphingobium sp.]|uniref:hypothetical protein n=1 Tax=Novosphingobium sp. TaxID=1874826 RepID=UPI0025FB47F2|nr:hypothetical protein [Novosphingobium sp.]
MQVSKSSFEVKPIFVGGRSNPSAYFIAYSLRGSHLVLPARQLANERYRKKAAEPIRRSSAATIGSTRESLPIRAIAHRIAALAG